MLAKSWLKTIILLTLQLHAYFIPTQYTLHQVHKIFWRGYKFKITMSTLLHHHGYIPKSPRYEGTHQFLDIWFEHFLGMFVHIWLIFLVELAELYFWSTAYQPPSLKIMCNHNFFFYVFRMGSLQKSFLRCILCCYHLLPWKFLQDLGRRKAFSWQGQGKLNKGVSF